MASDVSAAVRGGFQICEAEVGARLQPAADGTDLSSLLAQILGPVFLDVERNVSTWQRVRDSQLVQVIRRPDPAPDEDGPVDIGRLIDSFQLGAKNLQDVWSSGGASIHPARNPEAVASSAGAVPDVRRVWVSIVYDFALAYRVRTINRDHLLRSFTPLYLGWIASYALEMEAADRFQVEARLERLARAYERISRT